jgi:DNA-binding LacI/PurR family transcriptional regulator
MARMKDVADRCGVAESTVSHVLNNTRYVSPKIKDRVLAAMRELSYHGNAHARRLARGVSDFLGLIISDIENPFFPGLIKAFESAALRHGFDVLLSTTNYEPQRTEKAFRKMVENKAPGVAVLTSGVDPALAGLLESNGVASIFLDAGSVGPKRSNVRLNYAKGANEAVHYLYNLGHRDFALIAGPQNRHSHVAYREAIAAALQETDLQPQVLDGSNDVEGGARASSNCSPAGSFRRQSSAATISPRLGPCARCFERVFACPTMWRLSAPMISLLRNSPVRRSVR